MVKRLQYAVVGCGGRGLGYVRLLADSNGAFGDVDLRALCDPHEPTREQLGREHGIASTHLHETVEAMLLAEGDALDCVVIATPAHLNKICALPCIQQGLHAFVTFVTKNPAVVTHAAVMMEKPPGLSVAETTELRDAAAAAGVKGMVAWNRRFHPIIAKAREMVLDRGPITQVLGEFHKDMRSFVDENIAGANMSSGRLIRGQGRKREWFDGEEWHLGFPPHILDKMFMESPVHALDVVRAMGGDVADCHAFSRRAFTDYRDVHTVSMLHTGGCISTVIANYTQPKGNRLERYEIHGQGITAHLEGVSRGYVLVDGADGPIDISGSTGAGDGGTTEQLRFFTDAVLHDRAIDLPAANFDEAIKTMTVAEQTLNASPDTLSTQLKALIAASEAGAQRAWKGASGGVEDQVSATTRRLASL